MWSRNCRFFVHLKNIPCLRGINRLTTLVGTIENVTCSIRICAIDDLVYLIERAVVPHTRES